MRIADSAFVLLALLGGCAGGRSFDVSVTNEAARPVTIALTKTGGPIEDRWASPEQIAEGKSSPSVEHGIVMIAAGKTAHVNNLKAQVPADAQAVLRVYGGDPTYGEMLKMLPGRGRVDITLVPGANILVVRETAGGLMIERLQH